MKKSLLAVLCGVMLATSGCEDKANAQKLADAEKTVGQLESQLKTAQSELAKFQQELTAYQALKSENESLKQALAQLKGEFPTLNVEIVELFKRAETVKIKKDPKDEVTFDEASVSSEVTIPRTQVEWLDQLLLQAIFNPKNNAPVSLESVKQRLAEEYQAQLEEVKSFPVIAMEYNVSSEYLGQRNHLVTFSILTYSYTGGAHGLYASQLLNIDTQKRKIITLNDLIAPEHQEKVKALLWEEYSGTRLNEEGKYDGFADKAAFEISPNFYFTPNGIAFVYPPYELGPFAEGEVEVVLPWYQGKVWINPAYQYTEAAGLSN